MSKSTAASSPWLVPESVIIASRYVTRDGLDALITCGAIYATSDSESNCRSDDRQIDILALITFYVTARFKQLHPGPMSPADHLALDVNIHFSVASHIGLILTPHPSILARVLAAAAPGNEAVLADPERCHQVYGWELAHGSNPSDDRAVALLVAMIVATSKLNAQHDPAMN